jgi:hypothetical protein
MPRKAPDSPLFTGIAANTPYLTVLYADLTPGTACPYNNTGDSYGYVQCTGQQIAPYLVLTSANCLSAKLQFQKLQAECPNAAVVEIEGKVKESAELAGFVGPANSCTVPDLHCLQACLLHSSLVQGEIDTLWIKD